MFADNYHSSQAGANAPELAGETAMPIREGSPLGELRCAVILDGTGAGKRQSSFHMSHPSEFIVKIYNDRDIVISNPTAGFEVTYRREMYSPLLIAPDVLRNDFDDSKAMLLAQAWKLALGNARSLGWLDAPRLRRRLAD